MSITGPDNREEQIPRQAMERPPAERTAFLETACGDDTLLLQRVVALLREKEAAAPQGTVVDPNALRDWIVMKCLEKDRTFRYELGNPWATEVQRFLNSEPVVLDLGIQLRNRLHLQQLNCEHIP